MISKQPLLRMKKVDGVTEVDLHRDMDHLSGDPGTVNVGISNDEGFHSTSDT